MSDWTIKDFLTAGFVVLILMAFEEVNAQTYMPGNSTTPGAYSSIHPYTGWAQIEIINPMYRCPNRPPEPTPCKLIGFQIAADYIFNGLRYRVVGISTRPYVKGEQVRVENGALKLL